MLEFSFALKITKNHPGRSAKTNFPISDYDAEVAAAIAAEATGVYAPVSAASPRGGSGGGGRSRNAPFEAAAAAAAAAATAKAPSPSSSSLGGGAGLLRAPALAATITLAQLAAALTGPR